MILITCFQYLQFKLQEVRHNKYNQSLQEGYNNPVMKDHDVIEGERDAIHGHIMRHSNKYNQSLQGSYSNPVMPQSVVHVKL